MRENRTKEEIRRLCRRRRREKSEEERNEKSGRICEQIRLSERYRRARTVFAYIAVRGEADLRPLLEDAWESGRRVAVPRVCGENMNFFEISSYRDLTEGAFHIPEPKEGAPALRPEEETAPLFLVPGTAFDPGGRRIGSGGGYYDRFLAGYPQLPAVGVGFDFQIFPELPQEETDRRLCGVVTESGWITPPPSGRPPRVPPECPGNGKASARCPSP